MKNTKRMIGWPGGFALLLAAAFITACSEEEFTREAGTVPGEETLTGVSAELYRPAVGSRIRLSDADATDVLRLRLSQLIGSGTSQRRWPWMPTNSMLTTKSAEPNTNSFPQKMSDWRRTER